MHLIGERIFLYRYRIVIACNVTGPLYPYHTRNEDENNDLYTLTATQHYGYILEVTIASEVLPCSISLVSLDAQLIVKLALYYIILYTKN